MELLGLWLVQWLMGEADFKRSLGWQLIRLSSHCLRWLRDEADFAGQSFKGWNETGQCCRLEGRMKDWDGVDASSVPERGLLDLW